MWQRVRGRHDVLKKAQKQSTAVAQTRKLIKETRKYMQDINAHTIVQTI
jgi:hypothetical protein